MDEATKKRLDEMKKQADRLQRKGRTSDAQKKRVEIARLLLEEGESTPHEERA